MVKEYGYYKQLLALAKYNKEFPIKRINEIGSRMSSKTWSGLQFAIMLCLIAKTKVDAFRYFKGKDRQELFLQFGSIIENEYPGLIDKLDIHKTRGSYTFPNGSVIEVQGLHVMGSDEVKLTGKSGAAGFDYHIAIAEERYEIDDELWSAVLQALRGTDKFLEIHLANPWVFTNDYVRYCHEALNFDLEALIKDGQQYKVVEKSIKLLTGETVKYKEIFHYTNYQINHYLSLADKVKLEIGAEHDPHRANTILYGYPGSPKGGIWKWVLPKMKQLPSEPSVHYVGGLDYGEKADATAGYIIGFNSTNSHAHVEHEYYWANNNINGHKDTRILAEEVVNHYLDFMEDNDLVSTLDIYVDGSSIPFITALNTYTQNLGYDDVLKFHQQTNKKRVADRIETMKTMASFGLITIDKYCKNLLRELNEQVYANKSRQSADYVDGDDHGTDAMYYGLVTKWIELLENQEMLHEEQVANRMEAQ